MADTNYVKFLRGTPEQYASAVKNSDTLYFIMPSTFGEGAEKVGSLYLGDVLLAGNLTDDKGSIIDTLGELKDVDLSAKAENSLLGYDGEKWVPMTIEEAMGSSVIKTTQIFEVSVEKGADHVAAITTEVGDKELQNGDIAIVKEVIAGDKLEYTSYVYNGTAWAAMDGNYSAENVYLSKDISFAGDYTSIGNYKKGGDSLKAGTSLQSILSGLLEKELYPKKTAPSASIAVSGATGEVGTTYTVPTATLTTTIGSYTYGPVTGVTYAIGDVTIAEASAVTGIAAADNKKTNEAVMGNNSTLKLTASGATGTFGDTAQSYTFVGQAKYSDGAMPVTNLGNEYPSEQIKSTTIDIGAKTATFTGWYKNWYYIGENTEAMDSAWVRANATGKDNNGNLANTYTIPAGTKRVMFAYQGTHTIKTCIDVDGMGLDVKDNFTTTTLDITGANGIGKKSYTVFTCENANGLAATKYTISFN